MEDVPDDVRRRRPDVGLVALLAVAVLLRERADELGIERLPPLSAR